jgi:transposase
MDLSETYRAIVRRHFPNAMIVADRFHAIRLVGQCPGGEPRPLPALRVRSVLPLQFEADAEVRHASRHARDADIASRARESGAHRDVTPASYAHPSVIHTGESDPRMRSDHEAECSKALESRTVVVSSQPPSRVLAGASLGAVILMVEQVPATWQPVAIAFAAAYTRGD